MLDTFDRRILRTYLNEYFGDFLFDPLKPFSLCDGKSMYTVPMVVSDDVEFLGKYSFYPRENCDFI